MLYCRINTLLIPKTILLYQPRFVCLYPTSFLCLPFFCFPFSVLLLCFYISVSLSLSTCFNLLFSIFHIMSHLLYPPFSVFLSLSSSICLHFSFSISLSHYFCLFFYVSFLIFPFSAYVLLLSQPTLSVSLSLYYFSLDLTLFTLLC